MDQSSLGPRLYDSLFGCAMGLIERALVPDALLRVGMRYLLRKRLVKEVRFKNSVTWCECRVTNDDGVSDEGLFTYVYGNFVIK